MALPVDPRMRKAALVAKSKGIGLSQAPGEYQGSGLNYDAQLPFGSAGSPIQRPAAPQPLLGPVAPPGYAAQQASPAAPIGTGIASAISGGLPALQNRNAMNQSVGVTAPTAPYQSPFAVSMDNREAGLAQQATGIQRGQTVGGAFGLPSPAERANNGFGDRSAFGGATGVLSDQQMANNSGRMAQYKFPSPAVRQAPASPFEFPEQNGLDPSRYTTKGGSIVPANRTSSEIMDMATAKKVFEGRRGGVDARRAAYEGRVADRNAGKPVNANVMQNAKDRNEMRRTKSRMTIAEANQLYRPEVGAQQKIFSGQLENQRYIADKKLEGDKDRNQAGRDVAESKAKADADKAYMESYMKLAEGGMSHADIQRRLGPRGGSAPAASPAVGGGPVPLPAAPPIAAAPAALPPAPPAASPAVAGSPPAISPPVAASPAPATPPATAPAAPVATSPAPSTAPPVSPGLAPSTATGSGFKPVPGMAARRSAANTAMRGHNRANPFRPTVDLTDQQRNTIASAGSFADREKLMDSLGVTKPGERSYYHQLGQADTPEKFWPNIGSHLKRGAESMGAGALSLFGLGQPDPSKLTGQKYKVLGGKKVPAGKMHTKNTAAATR